MRRRTLLRYGLLGALGAAAGCLDGPPGSNPDLRVRNAASDPVDLAIAVTPDPVDEAGTSSTPTFAETVAVDAGAERVLAVFEPEGNFRVRVGLDDRSVAFATRPICEEASTTVTVDADRTLRYLVEYCEGNPRTGAATSAETDG